jgi:hypothetical protein
VMAIGSPSVISFTLMVRSFQPRCKSSWPMPSQDPGSRNGAPRDIAPCSARQSLMLVAYFLATTDEAA